jgi:hypothetical protein
MVRSISPRSRKRFINELIRGRVVPTISASSAWEIFWRIQMLRGSRWPSSARTPPGAPHGGAGARTGCMEFGGQPCRPSRWRFPAARRQTELPENIACRVDAQQTLFALRREHQQFSVPAHNDVDHRVVIATDVDMRVFRNRAGRRPVPIILQRDTHARDKLICLRGLRAHVRRAPVLVVGETDCPAQLGVVALLTRAYEATRNCTNRRSVAPLQRNAH